MLSEKSFSGLAGTKSAVEVTKNLRGLMGVSCNVGVIIDSSLRIIIKARTQETDQTEGNILASNTGG